MGSISQTLSLSLPPCLELRKLGEIKTREMSDTLFLLDMLRLANQEKVRAKKDERIHDMAMEQKKKMEEAKKIRDSKLFGRHRRICWNRSADKIKFECETQWSHQKVQDRGGDERNWTQYKVAGW